MHKEYVSNPVGIRSSSTGTKLDGVNAKLLSVRSDRSKSRIEVSSLDCVQSMSKEMVWKESSEIMV